MRSLAFLHYSAFVDSPQVSRTPYFAQEFTPQLGQVYFVLLAVLRLAPSPSAHSST